MSVRRTGVLLMFCVAVTTMATSQLLTTAVNFAGSNGSTPVAPIIKANDKNFYGTTSLGGLGQGFGDGTVFRITSQGAFSTLHSFQGADGMSPQAGLVQATDGNLYGTTVQGGSNGGGSVFRITTGGSLTTIHSFAFADGYQPYAGLIQATDGNLYGTTSGGGANGKGSVYKITLDGSLTTLHSFQDSDGNMPYGTLVQGLDGNFYGTTEYGGVIGQGTVFKMTPQGDVTTLHSFLGPDGENPYAGLVLASDGNFYGTAPHGGANNCGTVFRITPIGLLSVLHNFNCNDGLYPNGLIQAIDHNLYGTTTFGGNSQVCFEGCGTIFKISLDGQFTSEYSFNGSDGAAPAAALFEFVNGVLYGTTSSGGANGDGTAFHILIAGVLSVAKSGQGTVTSGDEHIYCGPVCSYNYSGGVQVGLTAIPAPGYTFSSWTGCTNVNGAFCLVFMDNAKNVIATFQAANINVTSLTFKPASVKGGNISVANIMIDQPAPPGGVAVAMSTDQPLIVHPPSTVVIPGGQTSISFAVRTSFVTQTTVANVTATINSSQKSATLTVTPANGQPLR